MNAAEFESVVRNTQSVLRAYIAGMGIPLDTVDDLAQEVYLEFYRSGDRRPAEVEPVRWLKGIAKNLCLNYFRSSRRRANRHLEAVAVLLERLPSRDPDLDPERLDGCLEKLPERSRTIVNLRYREGLESPEIGRRLDLTAEAVRVALLRIRSALRECLARGGAP